MRRKKKSAEQIRRKKERKEVRRKNISDYFLHASMHHRAWMQELADAYKARGVFPALPILVLPSYYHDARDREVAAFAALLIPADEEYWRINEFRKVMGDHPFEWLKNREFVHLSIGDTQNMRTGGVTNWRIARLMDVLWEDVFEDGLGSIRAAVSRYCYMKGCTYFDAVMHILSSCSYAPSYRYMARLLLMTLGSDDGFGFGIWKGMEEEIRCPIDTGMPEFVSTWFPDYRRYGQLPDAVRLFGMRNECDLLYAFWGYKELQKRNPDGCSNYATSYLRWYEMGVYKSPYVWRNILPAIDFG